MNRKIKMENILGYGCSPKGVKCNFTGTEAWEAASHEFGYNTSWEMSIWFRLAPKRWRKRGRRPRA